MSSLTIEELKKALREKGVALPGGKSKKEEYVKLYEEHIALNASIGDTYSSDEENSQSSKKVTSTNSLDLSGNIPENVGNLSADELFEKLKEFGLNAGPVLPNTRKIYEKKLIQFLMGGGTVYTNGVDDSVNIDPSELSDNEIELQSIVSKRRVAEEKSKKYRDSPQPSTSKRDPSPFVSDLLKPRESSLSKPTRFSYIETVSRGGSRQISSMNESSESGLHLRNFSGISLQKGNDSGEYVGGWSPNLSRFRASTKQPSGTSSGKKIIILSLIAVAVFIAAGFVYYQWTVNDPYKLIEESANNEVLKATQKMET